MANTFEILFEHKPLTWGLRGDTDLWDDLKEALAGIPLPDTPEEMKIILYNKFEALIGEPPLKGKNMLVSRYPRMRMSGGVVCSNYWIDKGFPILIERYEKVLENETSLQLPLGLSQEGILLLAMLSFKQISSWDGGMYKIYEWQSGTAKFSLVYDRGYFDGNICPTFNKYSLPLIWLIRFILNNLTFYEVELKQANLYNTLTPDSYVQLLYTYYPLIKSTIENFSETDHERLEAFMRG